MSGVVERVAKELCESDGFSWSAESHHETANGDTPEEQREYWRIKARIAIEALREPTEAMLFAADWLENGTRAAWQAMIDEARKELP